MSLYDLTVKSYRGEDVSLSQYQGKVLLIVNTATGCGFTPQYEGLESLYKKYREQGFEILDFPCNQFKEQAPGSDEEIHQFCTLKYDTTFPRFKKVDVNGENASPVFAILKQAKPDEEYHGLKAKATAKLLSSLSASTKEKGDILWNFTKFLVDREGNVVARFSPMTDAKEIEPKLAEIL